MILCMYLFIIGHLSSLAGTRPGVSVPPHPSVHTHTHIGLERAAHLKHNPGFLQQVLRGYGTRDHAPGVGSTVSSRGRAKVWGGEW